MMTGVVNAALEATLRLAVQDAAGHPHDVDTVLDTGFTGFLSLPPTTIAALGLPWLCRQCGQLADGSVQVFDVYAATVIWDGQPVPVEVEAAATQPLVGMALLQGYEVRIHVAAGGFVTLVAVP